MGKEEQALIMEKERIKMSTLCWSVKESIYKWWGSGGVDFIKHIHIERIDGTDEGTVQCIFKNKESLAVRFLFFNNTCLCWLTTKIG